MKVEYLYLTILFFSFITLILVVSMLLIVIAKKNILRKRLGIASLLEGWLMDIILETTTNAGHVFAVPDKHRLLLQTPFARKVLLCELIKAKKSLSGISGVNLEKVYHQQKLYEISLKRMASKLWHVKATGIQELATMNQQDYCDNILALTNHIDPMVRMEAQTAMVRLKGFKGMQFFDNLSYPVCEWHQLNLLQLVAHHQITEADGIIDWLHSPNSTVVQFSLKLIADQHAIEFHKEVAGCLDHPDEIVRREAILCLAQMPSPAAAEELNLRYVMETDKNIRLCIIDSFKKTGSNLDLPFLETLQQAVDVDINLAANKTVLYLQKLLKAG